MGLFVCPLPDRGTFYFSVSRHILQHRTNRGERRTTEQEFFSAAGILSPERNRQLLHLPKELTKSATELRLRVGQPVAVTRGGRTVLLSDGPTVTSAEVEEIFYRLCRNAVYAKREEIAAGFLTAPGGHRVGLCGRAVAENGRVIGVKELTSLNIRISRRHPGIAGELVPLLLREEPCSALLFGPPLSGKTTVLRELSYEAAHMGYRVAVVDEREELAFPDAPMDVFRGYPRKQGVWQALRLFSPDILVFDELGDPEDVEALQSVAQSGVALFTTVHAADLGQLQKRPLLGDVMTTGVFRWLIRLSSGACPGQILDVYDGAGNPLSAKGKMAVTR